MTDSINLKIKIERYIELFTIKKVPANNCRHTALPPESSRYPAAVFIYW